MPLMPLSACNLTYAAGLSVAASTHQGGRRPRRQKERSTAWHTPSVAVTINAPGPPGNSTAGNAISGGVTPHRYRSRAAFAAPSARSNTG